MKLSILVPVYNVENYLSACLDSLIDPTLADYEIIIVDDGSTDSSARIAADYAARYPGLIRLISQENGGLGAARNTGIEAASGDYLLFVDSDDTLAPNALSEMMARLSGGFDLCVFGVRSVNENGDEVSTIPTCVRDGVFDLKSYPALLLAAPSACNKLCRRSLFISTGIRFPGRVWYEDLRTIPKLYLDSARIVSDPRQWYVYLQRSGSITNNSNLTRNLEIIDAVDDLIAYYKARGCYDLYKDELTYCAFYNQFLAAAVRVNLTDAHSALQEQLVSDFLKKFPDYRQNPYIRRMRFSHKLLTRLLLWRCYTAVHLLMKANNLIKHKNF